MRRGIQMGYRSLTVAALMGAAREGSGSQKYERSGSKEVRLEAVAEAAAGFAGCGQAMRGYFGTGMGQQDCGLAGAHP